MSPYQRPGLALALQYVIRTTRGLQVCLHCTLKCYRQGKYQEVKERGLSAFESPQVVSKSKIKKFLKCDSVGNMTSNYAPTYYPSGLDKIENLEKYKYGGFHPVSIGDIFADGRYRVLHKLGFGGTSTVWLVQDQDPSKQTQDLGHLVALKIILASESSKPTAEIADFFIPEDVDNTCLPGGENILTASDYFLHDGPNGTHLCLIYRLAGPKIISGAFHEASSRRLPGDLARAAYQAASAVKPCILQESCTEI